jgi:hypothetical protein
MPAERARILVANEPRAYREVLAGVLRELRPHLHVVLGDPASLDQDAGALRPRLLICSQLTDRIADGPWSWILLYPDGDQQAVVQVEGRRTDLPTVGLDDLLDVIDAVAPPDPDPDPAPADAARAVPG